jgi:hypothetical protein
MQADSGLIDDAGIYNVVLIAGEVATPARQAAFERDQTPNITKGLRVGKHSLPFFHVVVGVHRRVFTFSISESWQIRRQDEEGFSGIL